jgi:hypothetical protein
MSTPDLSLSVEDFLTKRVLSYASQLTGEAEAKCQSLMQELEGGRKELMEVHRRVVEGENEEEEGEGDKENSSVESSSSSNVEPSSSSTTKKQSLSSSSTTSTKPSDSSRKKQKQSVQKVYPSLQITITSGPHSPLSLTLPQTFRPNHPALLGRSTGKKFKEGGVSLGRDLEVSTTHGKFEMTTIKGGNLANSVAKYRLTFTDSGSTNGTFVVDRKGESNQVDEGEAIEITDATKIRVGATVLEFVVIT